jgi:hypothetical protein
MQYQGEIPVRRMNFLSNERKETYHGSSKEISGSS